MPNLLPCIHPEQIVGQVQPTIDLLRNLDTRYPNVLRENQINPPDYHGNLVFRSAVESIRGEYAARATTRRQGLIERVLVTLQDQDMIAGYVSQSAATRCDFEVRISEDPLRTCGIEVKGGEGNSIKISERPYLAQEFFIWSHLDGAIRNQPSEGVSSIVFGRLISEITQRHKQVDALIVRDALCGTPTRPCPKYLNSTPHAELGVAPDVFLFPRRIPISPDDESPPIHDQRTLLLPFLILRAYGVPPDETERHIWKVHIEVFQERKPQGPVARRRVWVEHEGKVLTEHISTMRKPKVS